jgi:hypothetical protein
MQTEGKGDLADCSPGECVRGAWRGFNRWRKKYWLTRVIILLLIFAPSIADILDPRGPLITRLVRMAIQAIQLSSEPRMVYARARFYRVEEAERLRMQLWGDLAPDGDRMLNDAVTAQALAAGLAPEQLTCSLKDADLEQLAAAAKRLGLMPASYSTTAVYEHTWYAAQAEVRRLMKPYDEKIEALLRTHAEPLDYTKWRTWKRGIDAFLEGVFGVFGTPRAAATWFLGSFLIGGVGSVLLRRYRPQAGFVIGASLALIVMPLAALQTLRWWSGHFGGDVDWHLHWDNWLRWAGYALLTGAAGYAGGRAAAHVTHRLRAALAGAALLGFLLVAWGATPRLALYVAYWWAYGPDGWEALQRDSMYLPGWSPAWVNLPCIAAGLALAAGGLAGLWFLGRRKRRRAVLEKGVESDINGGHERR